MKSVIQQKRWHRDKVCLKPPAHQNAKAVTWVYSWLNRLEKLLRSTTAVLAVYSPMINHCPMYAPEDLFEACQKENIFYELTEMPKKVESDLHVMQNHVTLYSYRTQKIIITKLTSNNKFNKNCNSYAAGWPIGRLCGHPELIIF